MFTFLRDDCDTAGASDAPAPALVPQDNYSPRLPRPRSSANRRDYRGILGQRTASDLSRSAESGSALEAVAPALGSASDTGGSWVLLLIIGVGLIASRSKN